jgi:hypothetical protein
VVGAAVNQFIASFDAPDNEYAKAALRFSPLLLLAPQSRGRGVEGLIKDPRVIGAAAVAGLVFVGENRNQDKKVHEIKVHGPETIAKAATVPYSADVLDGKGRILATEKVTWISSDPGQATIDANTGTLVAANKGGYVIVTATAGDIVGKKYVTITP